MVFGKDDKKDEAPEEPMDEVDREYSGMLNKGSYSGKEGSATGNEEALSAAFAKAYGVGDKNYSKVSTMSVVVLGLVALLSNVGIGFAIAFVGLPDIVALAWLVFIVLGFIFSVLKLRKGGNSVSSAYLLSFTSVLVVGYVASLFLGGLYILGNLAGFFLAYYMLRARDMIA